MHTRVLSAGAVLLLPLLLGAQPAAAQRVSADIRIGAGPISGSIHIRPDRHYRSDRFRPRTVRVDLLRWRDYGHRRSWLRDFRRDSRVVVIFVDRRDGRYYDRFRPGLVEVRAFQRGGRFYRWDDDRFDRWDRDDRYDRRDRDDRYDRKDRGRRDW